MDCIAKSDCVCYSVTTSILKSMLGNNFRSLLYLNFIKSSFNRSQIFGKFNVHLLDKVKDLFRSINLKKDECAYKKGYIKSKKIVVVIDGNLINSITNDIVANRGDILFEDENNVLCVFRSDDTSAYLRDFDKIITQGKDLYDNKPIR